MPLSINDLNDDVLLCIFQQLPLSDRLNLPLVNRRFNFISQNYSLHRVQKCLGILTEKNCDYIEHRIKDEETIHYLVMEREDPTSLNFNPQTSLNKFQLSRPMLEQLLARCDRLKVLSLRLIDEVDNRILTIMIKYCKHLEHLTFSTTSIRVSSLVWLDFCTEVCKNLKCLNLEYVDHLTDHLLSNILRKSINLEAFSVSGNDQQQGYFFENFSNKIQSVTIRKVDLFGNNQGTTALMSLISEIYQSRQEKIKKSFVLLCLGNGRQIRKLKFKGRLSNAFLNQINLIQKNFKNLSELEIGDSLDDTSSPFQRILGQTVAKISKLNSISFNLPQLTPFTASLNSFFSKLVEFNHQDNIRCFRLNGAQISDKCIELLCANCRMLNEFHISHNAYFSKENFGLTNKIYQYLCKLKDLSKLSINGLSLDDQMLSLILKNCKLLTRVDVRNCWNITIKSLIELENYVDERGEEELYAYLFGTQISLLNLTESNHLFNYQNLRISFKPLKENLIEFDIIEDDFVVF